jgi:hypothetical protein
MDTAIGRVKSDLGTPGLCQGSGLRGHPTHAGAKAGAPGLPTLLSSLLSSWGKFLLSSALSLMTSGELGIATPCQPPSCPPLCPRLSCTSSPFLPGRGLRETGELVPSCLRGLEEQRM